MVFCPEIQIFGLNMQLLRFLSRVAFICNICFLLASFVQWLPHPIEGEIIPTVWLLSLIVNMIVNAGVLAVLILKFLFQRSWRLSPLWLLIVNGIFFIIQIILIIEGR